MATNHGVGGSNPFRHAKRVVSASDTTLLSPIMRLNSLVKELLKDVGVCDKGQDRSCLT